MSNGGNSTEKQTQPPSSQPSQPGQTNTKQGEQPASSTNNASNLKPFGFGISSSATSSSQPSIATPTQFGSASAATTTLAFPNTNTNSGLFSQNIPSVFGSSVNTSTAPFGFQTTPSLLPSPFGTINKSVGTTTGAVTASQFGSSSSNATFGGTATPKSFGFGAPVTPTGTQPFGSFGIKTTTVAKPSAATAQPTTSVATTTTPPSPFSSFQPPTSAATTNTPQSPFSSFAPSKSGFGTFGAANQPTATTGFNGFGQSSAAKTVPSGFAGFGTTNQPSPTTTSTQSPFTAATTSPTSFGGFAKPSFGSLQPSSTSALPASTTSGAGLGFGGITATSTSTSGPSFGLGSVGGGGGGFLGGSGIAKTTAPPPSPFGNLNRPSGLGTTTSASNLQTGFNVATTTSPSQNSNLFSRLSSFASTQASIVKPFSAFSTGTTTTSAPSIFTASASTTTPSISVTKPSIIPQSTSVGLFQNTPSSSTKPQFGLARPTLKAPVSTGGFTTGTPISIGATTQPSTVTNEATPTSSAWLKNSNIETIINRWKKDLDIFLKKFHSQASELRDWDQKIIENSGRIVKLEEELSKADLIQSEIDSGLESIATRQDELEKMLSEYEVKFSEPVLDSTRPLDKEREKNYDMAEEINQELGEMSQVLSTIITDVNRYVIKPSFSDEINGSQETVEKEDIEDPMDEVINILNSHLTSLQWIDSTVNQLTQNVHNAKLLLTQTQSELQQQSGQNGTGSNSG
ncbi:16331_t:CDS:2 [Funneliformis geosporum]|uniref:11220_t:CDS:1 n=1 Tax=Funneliformis geosporum TaxID=1117311 RepID=A0A9W4WQS6_9GLOM|nr:11220_t:CDS:2 [Funneliformis geosporum]CAI2172989.1 16331_t:CDS:2 [Funneliformis geosporum]